MYSVDGGESSLGIDSEYVVYLDANGYAIYVEETEYNIADYAICALCRFQRCFRL